MIEPLSDLIIFGPFKLNRSDCSLMRRQENGRWVEVPLRPKSFDLLRYLAENPGRLIPQDEILERVWPNIHIQVDGLKGHILNVRNALGDDRVKPTYIETVRGRGYRFIAPIQDLAESLNGDGSGLMVGRASARRDLETLLGQAAAGEAKIGFVTGEPGIGKTALVAEFVNMLAVTGVRAVISHCLPGNTERDPYYPILDALTRFARSETGPNFLTLLSTIAPTWLFQFPWLISPNTAAKTHQEVFGATPYRMVRELCDLLDQAAKDTLLVFIFEDAHWADQATLDMINAIARRRLQTRLLILLTMRGSGDDPHARAAQALCSNLSLYHLGKEISLTPLTLEDVGKYLASVSGRPAPALAQILHTRSEGNPLFMTAMLEKFIQDGVVNLKEHGWIVAGNISEAASGAPQDLTRIIEDEVEKLDADAVAVLEAASLSEGVFSAPVNHAATSLDEARFESVCETLCRSMALIGRADDLALPNGKRARGYMFRHMIIREVIYERQSLVRRSAGHLAIGNRIKSLHEADLTPVATILARHFIAAEQWVAAVDCFHFIARNALHRFKTREAAATLEQALTFVRMLPHDRQIETEVELLEELARIYAGSLDARAIKTYSDLAAIAATSGMHAVECRALVGLGYVLALTQVDRERAISVFGEAATKSICLNDSAARARIQTFAYGWRSWLVGWSEADAAACSAALEEIKASGDLEALNAGLVGYCLILFSSSRYRETYDAIQFCYNARLNSPEKQASISFPLWFVRLMRPWALMYAGELGSALELFGSGVRSLLDNGEIVRASTVQLYQAFCHVHMLDFQGALDLCDQAQDSCAALNLPPGAPNSRQLNQVVRGLAKLGCGRVEEALNLLKEAYEHVRHLQLLTAWHWRMVLEWGIADAYLALDQIEDAQRHAGQLHDMAYAMCERTWRLLASETCARIALHRGDMMAAEANIQQGWREIEIGEVKLVAWRLHAVAATISDHANDEPAAERYRAAGRAALERLRRTLPPAHIGRGTLLVAPPVSMFTNQIPT